MIERLRNNIINRMKYLIETSPKILLISVDDVRADTLNNVRKELRGRAEIVMGRNSHMKRAIKDVSKTTHPSLKEFHKEVVGNVGFLFAKKEANLKDIAKILRRFKDKKRVKKGMVSTCDLIVPKGRTPVDPTKTQYLAALGIPSKITKGRIEVLRTTKILSKGERVEKCHFEILNTFKLLPLVYHIKIMKVYDDGMIYGPENLELSDFDLLKLFKNGVDNVASVSLYLNEMNMASIPHIFSKSFKDVLSVSKEIKFNISDEKE